MKMHCEKELMKEEGEALERTYEDLPQAFLESLGEVIEYLWYDEARGFAERGTEETGNAKHIFEHLRILRIWLSARLTDDS